MHTTTSPRIAFDDVGDGPMTLLYLPGWCANRTAFRDLLPIAARQHRAIALDWRGHGGSEPTTHDFGTAALVDDALAVITRSGAEVVVPVALAHSGWVAIELRRRLGPARVPGIVWLEWMPLGAPAPFLDVLAGLQDTHRWRDVRAQLFSMWTTGVDIPALDHHIDEMARYDETMWARAGREIATNFATEHSPTIAVESFDEPCPTLHLYAQPADTETLTAQEAYAAAHPWFSVERLPAASHFPMFEIPEHLQQRVSEFAHRLQPAHAH